MQLDLNSELIATVVDQVVCSFDNYQQLDPVGSTVRYEVMKLIIDVKGSVEGIYAFIY